jgi:hypothetical protein
MAKTRRPRYPLAVISFAVAERIRGQSWEEITAQIEKLFHIKPPSARRMREWMRRAGTKPRPSWPRSMQPGLRLDATAGAVATMRESNPVLSELLFSTILLDALKLCQDSLDRGEDPVIKLGSSILRRMTYVVGSDKVEKMIAELQPFLQKQDVEEVQAEQLSATKQLPGTLSSTKQVTAFKKLEMDKIGFVKRVDWTPEEIQVFKEAHKDLAEKEDL